MMSLFRKDRDFFDDLFDGFRPIVNQNSFQMKTDIKEFENGYELTIDLPGFEKENIQATIKRGYLTISATREDEVEEKDEKTGKYITRERFYGTIQRSFRVGDVDQAKLKAEFKDGVLKIVIPNEAKKIPVENFITIE
jgi:HSP20 family molecular chaperone IbpA